MSKTYNTEIISVGTELLLGHVTNTDARDVSELLSKIGINVLYHTVVGDNPQRLEDCVKIARERADIIITTGGLGPTCDDLTKEILARAFDVKLVEDKREMDTLYDYINLGKKLTDNNFRQALLPEGCTVFHNTAGTAPGCAFEKDGKVVVMLPGPPKECRIMLEKSAIPYLRQLSDEKIVSHTINIFGIGESAVDDIFAGEMNAMTNPSMAPYAKECDCLLKVTAKAHTEAEAEEMLRPVMAEVQEKLGEVVYGVDVDCIEQSVLKLLREKNMTFSAAESCTGGDRDMIEDKGAVSYEVAKEMAENVRRIIGTDIGVGVTGLAGPDGDGVHEVGTVFVSMATAEQTWVNELHLGAYRTRSFIRRMAGNHVNDMMRRYLSGLKVM